MRIILLFDVRGKQAAFAEIMFTEITIPKLYVNMIYDDETDFRWDTKCTLSHTSLSFVLQLILLSGDRSQTVRDVSDESLNTQTVFIDSQCNCGHPGSLGKF